MIFEIIRGGGNWLGGERMGWPTFSSGKEWASPFFPPGKNWLGEISACNHFEISWNFNIFSKFTNFYQTCRI